MASLPGIHIAESKGDKEQISGRILIYILRRMGNFLLEDGKLSGCLRTIRNRLVPKENLRRSARGDYHRIPQWSARLSL
jgi:hypothetical protein